MPLIMIVLIIFFLFCYQRCSTIFYWQGEKCLYNIIVVVCCLFIFIYISLACLESRSWKRWWHRWYSRLLFITSRAYQWVFHAIFIIFIILFYYYFMPVSLSYPYHFFFVELHDEWEDKENVVEFDFLGKDSVRYWNFVPIEKRVSFLLHI